MTDRDRLIELLKGNLPCHTNEVAFWHDAHIGALADYLIANGVTVGVAENAKTTDAGEVVRCKNCVHYGGVTFGFMCRKFSGIDTKICMPADGYCSYGERKVSE